MNRLGLDEWKVGVPFLLLVLAVLSGAVACGPGDGGEAPRAGDTEALSQTVPEWVLSDEPLLEIGVPEGEEAYQLHRVSGSIRLSGGRILVANAGSRELRLFDSHGQHIRSFGGDGEGPGEFRHPSRIRRLSSDSIMVWDRYLRRISFFDTDGSYLGARQLSPTRGIVFPGDEWLIGRYWIESPVAPEDRGPIRRAVEAMPAADTTQTVGFLKVTDEGWIWAASRRPPADTAIDWRIFDLRGRAVARVQTPARFQPHEIGPDYVLGRFQDGMDINYVHLYGLEKPLDGTGAPGLRTSVGSGVALETPRSRPDAPERVLAEIKSLVKNMASLQEIYYSDHYTYTTDAETLVSSIRGGPPEGVEISILFAGSDGWMGTFSHTETGAMCGLAYGYYVPMGWTAGEVICP